MRRWWLVLSLCSLLVAATAAGAERHYREVAIADPYIDLHTGPGVGYPIFFVAERGEQIQLLMRRTDWFKVRVPRGEEGWVHRDQLKTTLDPGGEEFNLPEPGLEDYAARRWEFGAMYGDFGGANVIATYAAHSFTPNLSGEVWLSQSIGQFSDSSLATVNVVHLMYPDKRISPYFTLGAGAITTHPKATLVATVDRTDSLALVGAGMRMYLSRRFVFRAEYKAHVVFTSRNENEDIREWKAGVSFFF